MTRKTCYLFYYIYGCSFVHFSMLLPLQALPVDDIEAGCALPAKIIAVVRPKSFNSNRTSEKLNQKFIVRENFEMSLEVKFQADDRTVGSVNHVYSGRITPSSYKGFHGLYIFPVGSKLSRLFQKAGIYTFSFSLVSNILVTDLLYHVL